MSCPCKIFNTDATIGSTFVLQFRLKDDDGEVINITGYRVAMAAKSKNGTVLFSADSEGEGITLDSETGATIQVLISENMSPQVADFDVLIEKDTIITSAIRGTITLLAQITDITP
jgi:hypothetical protein